MCHSRMRMINEFRLCKLLPDCYLGIFWLIFRHNIKILRSFFFFGQRFLDFCQIFANSGKSKMKIYWRTKIKSKIMAGTIAKIGILQKLGNEKRNTSQGQVQYLKLNTHSVHSPLMRTYAIKMCVCSNYYSICFHIIFLNIWLGLISYQSNHDW